MSAGYDPVAPDGHAKQDGFVAGSDVGLLVGRNVGGLDVGFDDVRGGCRRRGRNVSQRMRG
jgi:hypothetical protein